jgi:hypothetical protein
MREVKTSTVGSGEVRSGEVKMVQSRETAQAT